VPYFIHTTACRLHIYSKSDLIPTLFLEPPRPREVMRFAQGHTAREQWSPDMTPGCQSPSPRSLTSLHASPVPSPTLHRLPSLRGRPAPPLPSLVGSGGSEARGGPGSRGRGAPGRLPQLGSAALRCAAPPARRPGQ
jgi:hypothetical protein